MKTKYTRLFLLMESAALILTTAACNSVQLGLFTAILEEDNQPANEVIEASAGDIMVGLANPAAQYCEGLGYITESIERDGGMDADCVFPDSQRCGQWDFLAGRCGQEMSYCHIQGGEIMVGDNVGTCLFFDGSTCDEFQLFNGTCSAGDYPAEVIVEDIEAENVVEEMIQIQDFASARDHLMTFLAEEYGVENSDPWMEANINSPDAVGVSIFRYVSGPLTIVLSAEASAPYASQYNVQEATNRADGFWWTGTIALDGTITEDEVVLPWAILNPDHARDAALGYLYANYDISSPAVWIDEGNSRTGNTSISRQYRSGSWLAVVGFEPAAPMVSSYRVTLENSSVGLRWEGEIAGSGEIRQISFAQ
jgi:putative hemolysin